jgi:hypothetical protein
MIPILLAAVAGLGGYFLARNFVRHRLRFVDGIHSPAAPLIAGGLAFLLAWPVALLPLVSVATAVLFGIGIGFGTATGARQIRRSGGEHRQLTS